MKIDSLVMHKDDVGEPVGEFFGSPIYQACILDSDVREELDLQSRVRLGFGIEANTPIVLLPGEVLKDNIIRRETAAEVVGEDFYKQQTEEEGISGLKDSNYYDDEGD